MEETDVKTIVKTAQARWNKAFNSGDAAAVAELYTADGAVLPPMHAPVKGTRAIADFWMGLISAGVKDHDIELHDAQGAGDVAYSNGKWSATGAAEDGSRVRFEGTIVTILRRQGDGSWKTCLHIWN
ncbi:MAG: SgcJ/EcaC family oxidoreductase [Phyllobacterium sp.]|uniref:YybH family protein n=1 Tax=Phyllobacterium sp. TaxID=1871046 RepID=UPI0030F09F39